MGNGDNVLSRKLRTGERMTPAEVAPYFNRSANTIKRWARRNLIPSIIVIDSYQFAPRDVDRLLREGVKPRRPGRPRKRERGI
jgi:hypothetical protein